MKYFEIMMLLLAVTKCGASQDPSERLAHKSYEETDTAPDLVLMNYADYMNHAKATEGNVSCTDDGKYLCQDCLTPGYCDGGIVFTYPECTNGQACIESGGIAYCSPTQGECQCGDVVKACDHFNPDNVLFCDTNGPFWSEPCDESETCSEGQCISDSRTTETPTTSLPSACAQDSTGLFYVGTDCREAFYCKDGDEKSRTKCDTGKYYDPDLGCQPAPPKSCTNNCQGYCPDPVDCTKYHVCDGAGVSLSTGQCSEGEKFNPTATPPKCEVTEDDVCPKTAVCTDYLESDETTGNPTTTSPTTSSTTTSSSSTSTTTTSTPITEEPTTSTSTTSNPPTTRQTTIPPTTTEGNKITTPAPSTCNENTVGAMYPHEESCKMYYICSKTSTVTYEYVERSCVSILVFNPETLKCDMPENVPDCVP